MKPQVQELFRLNKIVIGKPKLVKDGLLAQALKAKIKFNDNLGLGNMILIL